MSNLRTLWIAALVFLADQISKYWALAHFYDAEPYAVTSFFQITLAHNKGMAFSLLAHQSGWQSGFLSVVTITISLVILIWLYQLPQAKKLEACALALILGGALSNLFDRMLRGAVVDFLDFHYSVYHWPIFNVADSMICLGALLFLLAQARGAHSAF